MSRRFASRVPRLGRRLRLVLAGLCLVLAAASATAARPAPAAGGRADEPVVVAARDLPAGRLLTAGDVTRVRWPVGVRPPGAATAVGTFVGRRLTAPISRREPLTPTRLLGRDLTTGLPAGTVAVPVTVAGARPAQLLHAGDRVELVAVGRAGDGAAPAPVRASAPDVVGTRLLILAVAPGRDGTSTDLVLGADHGTALQITRVAVSQLLAVLADPP